MAPMLTMEKHGKTTAALKNPWQNIAPMRMEHYKNHGQMQERLLICKPERLSSRRSKVDFTPKTLGQ